MKRGEWTFEKPAAEQIVHHIERVAFWEKECTKAIKEINFFGLRAVEEE